MSNFSNQIQIDTPNLSVLDLYWDDIFINCYKCFRFLHPLSIQYLFIKDHYCDYFLIFKNIKYLQCTLSDNLDWEVLSNYSQIQELHVEINSLNLTMIDELKENPFVNSQNLKIYMASLLVVDGRLIKKYDYRQNRLSCLMNNYANTADNLNFNWSLNYNKLMKLVNNDLPSNFFKKFHNIYKIKIYFRVKDQAYLIQFIKECANLYTLVIKNSHLNQKFFEELPDACSLRVLNISQEIELNFEFIHRMFNLSEFNIDQQLNFNDLKKLCYLESFRKVTFKSKINETIVTIRRYKISNPYRYNILDSNFRKIKEEKKMVELIRGFNSMNTNY